MSSFLKEYGGFLIATIAVIFAVFLINYAKNNYKEMSQHFIANLTGAETIEE